MALRRQHTDRLIHPVAAAGAILGEPPETPWKVTGKTAATSNGDRAGFGCRARFEICDRDRAFVDAVTKVL